MKFLLLTFEDAYYRFRFQNCFLIIQTREEKKLQHVLKLIERMENTQKRKVNRTSQKKDGGHKEEVSSGETAVEEPPMEKPVEGLVIQAPKPKSHRAPTRMFSTKRKGY